MGDFNNLDISDLLTGHDLHPWVDLTIVLSIGAQMIVRLDHVEN